MNTSFSKNLAAPISYSGLCDNKDYVGMSFVRQTTQVTDHRFDGIDFQTSTVYVRQDVADYMLPEIVRMQAWRNFVPLAMILSVQDVPNTQPVATKFDLTQVSEFVVSRRNFKVTHGTFIEQETSWGGMLIALDKLRSTAAALQGKRLGLDINQVFDRYSVSMDPDCVTTPQIQQLQTNTLQTHNCASFTPERVFTAKLISRQCLKETYHG